MNLAVLDIVAVAVALLSLAPLLANARRPANVVFAATGLVMAIWLAGLRRGLYVSTVGDQVACEFWVRFCSVAGCVFFVGFNLLRIALVHPDWTLTAVLRRSWLWGLPLLAVVAIVPTDAFLSGVSAPPVGGSFGVPAYGILNIPYTLIIIGLVVAMVRGSWRALREHGGIIRVEMQYIAIGVGLGMFLLAAAVVLLPIMTGTSETVPYGAVGVLVIVMVVAYGIAKDRILDARGFMRATVTWGLTAGWVVALYAMVLWLTQRVGLAEQMAHLAAALTAAFALAPGRGWMQRLTGHLFGGVGRFDLQDALRECETLPVAGASLTDFTAQFGDRIIKALGDDDLRIFLIGPDGPTLAFRGRGAPPADTVPGAKTITAAKRSTRFPVSVDAIRRRGESGADALLAELRELQADLVVAVRGDDALRAVIVLGAKRSGRIYTVDEQADLKLLADRFALSMQNMRLYDELQQQKAYSEALVENLAHGIIAVSAQGQVITCNREAKRLLGQQADDAVDQHYTRLPQPIATTLDAEFRETPAEPNRDIVLETGDDIRIVGITGGHLRSTDDSAVATAFVILNDRTRLKQLEDMVRDQDRHAAIGTLAAGIAHEIKNPLVAINTLAQLLPERYQSADFREQFTRHVSGEVRRINELVRRLMNMAKPYEGVSTTVDIQLLLTELVGLMRFAFRNQGIEIAIDCEDGTHSGVHGDPNLLRQAFLNLFLNAMDAMPDGGQLVIELENAADSVDIAIHDSGCGIPADRLDGIFDLFSTSKDTGTGLGLSITKTIVSEHHGRIQVRSTPGIGTTFTVRLPLERDLKATA